MTYYIKKLKHTQKFYHNDFTHMIEWSDQKKLKFQCNSRKEFDSILSAAYRLFGGEWSGYFNSDGKWSSTLGSSNYSARIYFKSEKYISLVLMAAEIPA